MISSAADPLKTLTASVGGNITLPDALKEEGFLLYGQQVLAQVQEKKLLEIYEESLKERLQWNQNTGYFTLTRLQKNDSGIYTVDSKKGRNGSEHKLMVYDSVATPNVSVLNRSSESCSLSCSVDSAQEDTTLLWSKDGKILKKNHSAASLSVTLFSQQDLNSSLQCVAENPAENKTVSVDVRTFCQLNHRVNTSSSTDSRHHLIPIPIVCGVILLLLYFLWRFCHQKKSTSSTLTSRYVTTDTLRNRSSEPSESERVKLTTIYDKLAFRSDSADHV